MPKYLFHGNFTAQGAKGLAESGGKARVKAIQDLAKSAGGKMESYYFAFGDVDYFVIVDLPDNAAAAAVALAVASSGAVNNKTTVLMTAQEIDEAAKQHPNYRPPGT
jgi:uncharacterized protein with GYD domain